MISALDDILEDFSLYLRVEKRLSEKTAKGRCYLVGKFLEVCRYTESRKEGCGEIL